jgi:DNA helicase-2/ATP-dependent DNA helicase PcrA
VGDRPRPSDVIPPREWPDILTPQQMHAVEAAGNFLLEACPGSGKTFAAGARFRRWTDAGLRVAATSYTNVGANQIISVVTGDLGGSVPAMSFVGTLHAYLLKYVFYPFAHLVMGSSRAPRVITADDFWDDVVFGGNNRIRAPVSRFQFRPDGTLCYRGELPRGIRSQEEAIDMGQVQALRMKQSYAIGGIASPDDAMHWTLRVLREFPDLAGVVASRFDEVLIDEAQDTSEMQIACLEEMCTSKRLASLVLIGDLDQSIYSFQGASPDRCMQLVRAHGMGIIRLTENRRSSQTICDTTARFRARDGPDRAVGPTADCPWPPELIFYDPARPEQAVQRLRIRLQALGVHCKDAAVLARVNTFVNTLNGGLAAAPCRPRPLALGRAVITLQDGLTITRGQIEAVDRVLAYTAWGMHELGDLDQTQRRAVRRVSMRLLTTLPALDCDLRRWIGQARHALDVQVRTLVKQPSHKASDVLRAAAGQEELAAADAFRIAAAAPMAQTVHDVKGEGRDAVLLVAAPRPRRREPEATVWSRPLTGGPLAPADAEEIRIVFVALTRARRYCAVALPADSDPAVVEAFESAGFIARDVERPSAVAPQSRTGNRIAPAAEPASEDTFHDEAPPAGGYGSVADGLIRRIRTGMCCCQDCKGRLDGPSDSLEQWRGCTVCGCMWMVSFIHGHLYACRVPNLGTCRASQKWARQGL